MEPQNGPLTDSGALRTVQKNTGSRVQRSSSLNSGCAFPRVVAYIFPVHTRVLLYGSFSRSYNQYNERCACTCVKDYGILPDLIRGDCLNDDGLIYKRPLASCKFFANRLSTRSPCDWDPACATHTTRPNACQAQLDGVRSSILRNFRSQKTDFGSTAHIDPYAQ